MGARRGRLPQERWAKPCTRLLNGEPRSGDSGESVSPRLDVPIVHIVPDATVSKVSVKEGISGDRDGARPRIARGPPWFASRWILHEGAGSEDRSGSPEDVNKKLGK